MKANATLLTPFDFSLPTDVHRPLGFRDRRRFWKQILPVTEIDYDGQKVKFDSAFHKALELAHSDKVFEQIPLVFADGANSHNEDPRNFGGEIVKMENRGKDGTWALIDAEGAAAKAIKANPRLGVSARIMQGVEKGGKVYDHAVRHLLMTMFPRVQGMEPWQAVDLSEDADVEVVDLTAEQFEQEDGAVKRTKTAKTKAPIDLSALSDDEFQQFLDLAEKAGVQTAVMDPEDEEVVDDDLDEDEDDDEVVEKPRKKKSKKVVTIENDSEESGPEGDEEDEDESTDLSDSRWAQFEAFQRKNAKEAWDTKRNQYVSQGVPPFLVDLAAPVLSTPGTQVLDLSDSGGSKVDVHKILTDMLDGIKNVVDLTDEIGHQVDLSDDQVSEADKFVKAWQEQYS